MRARMAELDIGPQKLGDKVGVSRQAIYQLLNGPTRDSLIWHKVEKALGRTVPRDEKPDDVRFRELAELWPDMETKDHEALIVTARRLTKKP